MPNELVKRLCIHSRSLKPPSQTYSTTFFFFLHSLFNAPAVDAFFINIYFLVFYFLCTCSLLFITATVLVYFSVPMEQPASLSVNAPPAPVIKRPPAPKLTYEEVRRMARVSVLEDFHRQKEYHRRVERAHIAGTDVHVIPAAAAAMSGAALSKEGDTRLLKEHTSASWGVHLYQWSLFGLTGVSSVSSAMGFYLTIYHNRMFLPVGPMMAVVAWRFWNALESAWEEQRFIDNAARIRDSRKGNPMNLVVKRAAKGSADSVEPVEGLS